MKKTFFILLAFLLLLPFSMKVQAGDWNGAQILTAIKGTIPVNDKFSFKGDLVHFEIPSDSVKITFTYLGFDYTLFYNGKDSLTIGPRLGPVMGWFEKDAILTSIFFNLKHLGKYNLFLEGDVYHYAGQRDFFGVYLADYTLPVGENSLLFGVGVEQVNEDFCTGLRVGFLKGPLTLEGQYWYSLPRESRGHSFRTFVSLAF
jgi:hypothetical protein